MMRESFSPAADGSVLTSGSAEVWVADLDEVVEAWPDWPAVLQPEELDRASRFVHARDRLQSGTARAVLRRLLGWRLGIPAGHVRFVRNHFGKPGVVPGQNPIGLHFNLSHSKDRILIGLVLGRAIGVDVEWVSPQATFESLAADVCTREEFEELSKLPPGTRLTEALRYWTLKEACLKAIGTGLSESPQRVRIQRDASGITGCTLDADDAWNIHLLNDPSGYVASVAVPGEKVGFRQSWFTA